MKVTVYNQQGKETGSTFLPKEIFEVKENSDLIYQMVRSQISNRRHLIAKTKDRSEVRGGGKKPWRQKGTGRARHGSIRSPLWKGGGVTFGPRTERVFDRKVPKKMRRKALFMVLSAKAKENLVLVLDDLKVEKPKTKIMAESFQKLFLKKGTGLVLLPKHDDNLFKSIRNIDGIKVMPAKDLNILEALSYKYLIMPKDSIKVIKETFLEKSEK
jgi:large subunit ribosomal protein L4